MTLPDERYRALKMAEELMMDLLDPSKTPRVPKAVRAQARAVLRHYPGPYYLEQMAEHAPNVIRKEIEPLTRMIMQYNQDKP
jgi:hypothetical protein